MEITPYPGQGSKARGNLKLDESCISNPEIRDIRLDRLGGAPS
jgi:hypothetical protein